MITDLFGNADIVKNPVFRKYSEIYADVYRRFAENVASTGIRFSENATDMHLQQRQQLQGTAVSFRNNGHSVCLNAISPSCVACQKGKNSITFFISLKCVRQCYFCFNENQEEYHYYQNNIRDCRQELEEMHRKKKKLEHIALTGGEPLLHKEEAVLFFRQAKTLYPKAQTRLYTCGELVDQEILQRLADAGLDEIRFSIKTDDTEQQIAKQLQRIEMAVPYIPRVMVEMPVIPNTLDQMRNILNELERIGIYGINLLEFCFPFHNVEVFNEKGFKVKQRPYKVLYNYWYAGGLPVDGSEQECLQLLEYSTQQNFKMGVHYCSLENKHTGQVYQQNFGQKVDKFMLFSNKDYFYKTAKVFGRDIPEVLKVFRKKNYSNYQTNRDHDFLEFHPEKILWLKGLEVEVAIASHVMEQREDGVYQREVAIDYTTPQVFNYKTDV